MHSESTRTRRGVTGLPITVTEMSQVTLYLQGSRDNRCGSSIRTVAQALCGCIYCGRDKRLRKQYFYLRKQFYNGLFPNKVLWLCDLN